MVRPQKCRSISGNLRRHEFKPVGIPARTLEKVVMTVDELESIRLVDLLGYYQEQAAEEMNISRQTLGRIVAAAHQKIAEALIQGKALQIQGGNFQTRGRAGRGKGRGRCRRRGRDQGN